MTPDQCTAGWVFALTGREDPLKIILPQYTAAGALDSSAMTASALDAPSALSNDALLDDSRLSVHSVGAKSRSLCGVGFMDRGWETRCYDVLVIIML